jgi:tetratricopeptide (TPR) repeat protein
MIRSLSIRGVVCAMIGAYCVVEAAATEEFMQLSGRFYDQTMTGRYAEAEYTSLRMLDLAATDDRKASALIKLGWSTGDQRRFAEAEKYLLQAQQVPLAPDKVNRGWILNNRGVHFNDQKRFAEADKLMRQALQVFGSLRGNDSPQYASGLFALGRAGQGQGKLAEADASYLKSLAIRKTFFGEGSEPVNECLSEIGKLRCQQGKLAEAEDLLNRALAAREKNLGSQHHEVAFIHENLAMLYRAREQYPQAEAADRRALEIRERFHYPMHRLIADSLDNLAIDLEKQNKGEDAAPLRTRAKDVRRVSAEIESAGRLPQGMLRVSVTSASATVKAGDTTVATVRKGDQFDVTQVNGSWYGIAVNTGGKQQTGWLHYGDLAVVTDPRRTEAVAWQSISPERDHFSAEFPGTPSFSTEVVTGRETRAYSRTTESLDYEVSYFDYPSLTFDQMIMAYTSQKGRRLQSQTAFEKNLYPGREYIVVSPDGLYSRIQLILVGRRWYIVSVDGDASAVHGDAANRFFKSFTLTE